jgi:hypothetical protein
VKLPQHALHIPAVHGADSALERLYVLRRHRLLRQPGGFQGFRSLDEVADADNLAVSDGGDDRKPKLGGRTAPLPDPRDAGVRDDDIAGLREVLGLRVELIELSA